MHNIDPYFLLGIGSMGIGLFFIVFLISKLNLGILSNQYFILLYLLVIWEIFLNLLVQSRLLYELPAFYLHSGRYRLMIFSMLLSWILVQKKEWKVYSILVLIPAAIDIGAFLIQQSGPTTTQKLQMIEAFYMDSRPGPHNPWSTPGLYLRKILCPILLLGFSFLTIQHFYRKNPRSEMFYGLRYILAAIGIFFLVEYPISLFAFRKWNYSFIEWPIEILLYASLVACIAFYLMGQLKAKKKSIFSHGVGFGSSYDPKKLTNNRLSEILAKVKVAVEKEKLYLNPNFTLSEMTKIIGINSHYISDAINTQTGLRFNDFINRYRVEESKKMLVNEDFSRYTIEAIAYKSGFKSKSSFYRAFKKETGLTPIQFRKENTSSN